MPWTRWQDRRTARVSGLRCSVVSVIQFPSTVILPNAAITVHASRIDPDPQETARRVLVTESHRGSPGQDDRVEAAHLADPGLRSAIKTDCSYTTADDAQINDIASDAFPMPVVLSAPGLPTYSPNRKMIHIKTWSSQGIDECEKSMSCLSLVPRNEDLNRNRSSTQSGPTAKSRGQYPRPGSKPIRK
jgi:hypothetical protein